VSYRKGARNTEELLEERGLGTDRTRHGSTRNRGSSSRPWLRRSRRSTTDQGLGLLQIDS